MNAMQKLVLVLVSVAFVFAPAISAATTVNIPASKDNSIWALGNSNATGQFLFTGFNGGGEERRALLFFDVASVIPPGTTIQNAELRLFMSRTVSGPQIVALHRLTSDWGEATSQAIGAEGRGATATAGDATWQANFLGASNWGTPGGDFVGAPSATNAVGGVNTYIWTSSQVIADVQMMLDNPVSNFGWILVGPAGNRNAKRFNSRESGQSAPVLVVQFDEVLPTEDKTWGAIKALFDQ
jgi:hypothetical protein